jgi:putative membrane protein
MKKTIAALFIGALLALPVFAAERPEAQVERVEKSPGTADKQESKVRAKTAGDADVKAWIKKAAQGGLAEVELGKLAAQEAQSSEVKEFAQRMVDEHSKANGELMKVASGKGVTPPTQLDEKHRKLKQELAKAKGAEFDKKYMDGQVKDHKEMIALFEKGAKSSDDQVQQFASSTLPTLKEHLQRAQEVHAKASPK